MRRRAAFQDHNRAWEFEEVADSEVSDAPCQCSVVNVLNSEAVVAMGMLSWDVVGQWQVQYISKAGESQSCHPPLARAPGSY